MIDVIFTDECKQRIRERKVWKKDLKISDSIRNEFGWDYHMNMMDSHPEKMQVWNTDKMKVSLNSFHSRPSAPDFAKEVFRQLNETFVDDRGGEQHITNIVFYGFGPKSLSYPRHKDRMDVFLVQVLGDVPIRLGVTEIPRDDDVKHILRPGECLWIPRGTYHHLTPDVSRITYSFAVEKGDDPSTYI